MLTARNIFNVLSLCLTLTAGAAPVINPIANVTVPAGKSIIIPITATVTNGRALTYTITGITNAMAIVTHTNNPFWKINVAQACAANAPGAFQTPYRGGTVTVTNVGDMTFMLFPEYAPQAVSIFQGLAASGFYSSNTIFHRVVSNFVIQGGDPKTNGTGGLVFQYNDEFNPQAIFSGNGQLALANSGKNTDGSQIFVTVGQQRFLDFGYTLFGQLVRGFNVLSNIDNTAADTNSRPLADEIITQTAFVPDTSDAVITLTATNRAGVTNVITVIASDGMGEFATNTFTARSITDSNSIGQPFLYGSTPTNIVAPVNVSLTNVIDCVELDGYTNYWFIFYADSASVTNSTISAVNSNAVLKILTYNETNVYGQLHLVVKPTNNYVGPVSAMVFISTNANWYTYYQYYPLYGPVPPYAQMTYTFVFGDTPIKAYMAVVAPQWPGSFTNLLMATFTNGVPGSALTNFSASVQWGDDSTNSAIITTNSAGTKLVSGAHSYAYSGIYPISVTIHSRLGVAVTVTNLITVIPSLSETRTGTTNAITWPSWAFGYSVESNTNLAGTNWVTLTNTTALSGFQNVMSNTTAAGQMYYRLKE